MCERVGVCFDVYDAMSKPEMRGMMLLVSIHHRLGTVFHHRLHPAEHNMCVALVFLWASEDHIHTDTKRAYRALDSSVVACVSA